jgi:predicted nucleic acid-binding protein
VTEKTGSDVVLLDSSAWLEYLTEDTHADAVEPYLRGSKPLLVPTIVIYEVYKKLSQLRGRSEAERFLSHALRQSVVPLDEHLALAAADASLRHRLAMADAVIFATAQLHRAELVTSDQAFRELPGVTLF